MRRTRLSFLTLALLALSATSAWAQQRRITGRVTAEGSGEPLASAGVNVVGTSEGGITNEEGVFSFVTASDGVLNLRVRRIGYQQRQVQVPAGQNEVDVQLVRDVLQLEGVVVTGQSTTLDRANATTATSIVTAEEVTRAPARSLENALQGKVVGANINMNSGAPGGGGQIQIRGPSSLLGQGEPLIVVDGVLINNSGTSSGLNSITQAGGSANVQTSQDNVVNRLAALGANDDDAVGGARPVERGGRGALQHLEALDLVRVDVGQAGEVRGNITQRIGSQSLQRGYGQRRYTNVEDAIAVALNNGIDTALVRAAVRPDGTLPFNDFTEQLYSNNDLSYETIASVSGGTERTRFSVSGTQRQEQGIAINTGARLQALRLNLDQALGSRLNLSVGLNATRNLLQRGVSNNGNEPNPSPIYVFGYTPSFFNLDSTNATGQYVRNPYNNANSSNPFETFRFLRANEDVSRYFGSLNLGYTALQTRQNKVDFNLNAGVDRLSQEGEIYSPNFLQYEPVDNFPGTAVQTNTSALNYNSGLNLTWLFTPAGGAYSLTTSAGVVQETQEQNRYYIRGRGLLPGVPRVDIGANTTPFQEFNNFRDQAILFNTQVLAFEDRLSLNVGTRSDRSSANGDPSKFYTFPRASASYQFRDLVPGVDVIKPRVGYGQTGNRPRYGDRDILLTSTLVDGSRIGTVVNQTVGNPNIRPEALRELEFGADVTALNQRLSFEGTYYDRTITDLLLQPQAAPSSGVTQLVINAGELQTRGLEFGLTGQVVQTNDFQWTSRATYQTFTQTLNDLPAVVPSFPVLGSFGPAYGRNRFVSGARTSYIWGNAPLDESGNVLPVGTFVTNPDAVAAVRDTILGDANPDFQMFFTNTLQYRRVGLSFLLDWRQGGDVVNLTNNLFDEGQQSRDYDAPSPVDTMGLGEYRYNAWNGGQDTRIYVQDGSFVKLREVALSYDVPESLVSRFGALNSLRLQLLGRNLFTWTDYWGADPEANNFGNTNFNRFIDLAPYPPGRQFFFSFDLGF